MGFDKGNDFMLNKKVNETRGIESGVKHSNYVITNSIGEARLTCSRWIMLSFGHFAAFDSTSYELSSTTIHMC